MCVKPLNLSSISYHLQPKPINWQLINTGWMSVFVAFRLNFRSVPSLVNDSLLQFCWATYWQDYENQAVTSPLPQGVLDFLAAMTTSDRAVIYTDWSFDLVLHSWMRSLRLEHFRLNAMDAEQQKFIPTPNWSPCSGTAAHHTTRSSNGCLLPRIF